MHNTLEPFAGDEAPVLFGVEHEYNANPYGADRCACGGDVCCGECGCCCACDGDCEEAGRSAAFPALPYGWELKDEHCGSEVVTPPTTDIVGVMSTFREIEAAVGGPRQHRDCGLHVHLNCNPRQGPAMNFVRFFELYQAHKEEFLYPYVPGVGKDRRHGSTWARELDPHWTPLEWVNDGNRYREINAVALSGHGTVEVRLGGGTYNMDRFEEWIRRLLTLADMATEEGYSPRDACAQVLASGTVHTWATAYLRSYASMCGEPLPSDPALRLRPVVTS